MKKLFVFLVVVFCSLFIVPSSASAADNFTTAYNVTYAIDEAGTAHVTMKVGLTNTSSQYYASQYKIQVGFDEISNLTAADPKGTLRPKLTKTQDGYSIDVRFKDKVVGKGKTLPLTLTFDTKDIARKRGTIWSINVPGIADQQDFSDFTVTLQVPPSFGTPAFIKPRQPNNTLTFTKQQLGSGGISVAFGDKQGYDFHLTYHLTNKNIFPVRTEIALPPSTNYQDVYYTSVEPQPLNVTRDKDGNWLAAYDLSPSEKLDVIAKGKAVLSLTPKKEVLTASELEPYLKEREYWQVSNDAIKKIAVREKTPEAIYTYVVNTLHYDFSRVTDNKPRLGAVGVLKNPDSAVCLEFTDLFIAIARAAGIPAREVNGYAYTQNARQRPLSLVKDILHAWPEYYDRDQQTWIMVDPTWGNTTGGIDYFHVLDFDHFAFVRKGIDSSYPIPAGGYKDSDLDSTKDVHVEFGQLADSPLSRLTLTPGFAARYISWLPIRGTVRIRNVSGGQLPEQTVTITSATLLPARHTVTIAALPPHGVVEVPVSFDPVPLLTNATHTFTIQVAGTSLDQTFDVVPFLLPDSKVFIIGGICALLGSIILIIALRTRRIPFFRRR